MTTLFDELLVAPIPERTQARPGRRSRPPQRQRVGVVDMTPWLGERDVLKRFDAKIARLPAGCHYWLGAISSNGYGKFQLGSRSNGTAVIISAHRFAYLRHHGQLPIGDLVRHACDEPSCVNPDKGHMIAGTVSENTLDWLARCHDHGNPLGDPRGPGKRARAIRDAILAAPTLEDQLRAAVAAATYTIGTQLDLLAVTPQP